MRVLLTGADGFLGWHARVRLTAVEHHDVIPVSRENWARLPELIADADAVIHVAGINRGAEEHVRAGNIALAQDIVAALPSAHNHPRVVFADSIQAGNETAYGVGKAKAGELLADACRARGNDYVDVRLPNLFGEHARPRYNSFVATFVEAVVNGQRPDIADRPIRLMHAQAAADALIVALEATADSPQPAGTPTSVAEVFEHLHRFRELYASGDIPALQTELEVDLFNTLRAALFPAHYPIPLTLRADHRGALVELVRAHGGQGQSFLSTTRPGKTRGDHFHIRKIERFVVVSGRARISLRRMFTNDLISFDVDGEQPAIVDMPTMWSHNITNTGDADLTTVFWTNELFDRERPDTYAEPVTLNDLLDARG